MGADTAAEYLPRIYYVNWFRRGENGSFLWPGYGDNSRVLAWVFDRCNGNAQAVDTPIGRQPIPGSLNTDGLTLASGELEELLRVDVNAWIQELPLIEKDQAIFGERLPSGLTDQRHALEVRLAEST
jgi:phosphoenolpyruvate carboxykinase (GTP)